MTTDQNALFSSLLADPSLLAFATEAYAKPAAPPAPIVTVTASVEASALITPSPIPTGTRVVRNGKEKVIKPISLGFSLKLPKSGSLGPVDFLTALRSAGVRQASFEEEARDEVTGEITKAVKYRSTDRGTPLMVHCPLVQRQDEKAAIAAFLGWDDSLPHGTQLDAARRQAQSTLIRMARLESGGQVSRFAHRSPEAHAAKWSVGGYVSGLPNAVQKLLADLGGRERLATDDLICFGKLRTFVQTGAQKDYETLLGKEFPPSKGVEEVKNEEGVTVGYKTVDVPNPILIKLAGLAFGGEKLINALASLEALAAARLDSIQQDLAGLNSDAPTPEQIERAHRAMLGRGAPTIEEGLSLLNTTPKA